MEQKLGLVEVYYPKEITLNRDTFVKITDVTTKAQEAKNEALATHTVQVKTTSKVSKAKTSNLLLQHFQGSQLLGNAVPSPKLRMIL